MKNQPFVDHVQAQKKKQTNMHVHSLFFCLMFNRGKVSIFSWIRPRFPNTAGRCRDHPLLWNTHLPGPSNDHLSSIGWQRRSPLQLMCLIHPRHFYNILLTIGWLFADHDPKPNEYDHPLDLTLMDGRCKMKRLGPRRSGKNSHWRAYRVWQVCL